MTQPVSRSGKRPAGVVLVMTLAMLVQGAFATTPPVTAAKPSDGLLPGIHYEDARAHADDRIDFDPGGRVNVGFTPRPNDAWKVDGKAPRALPAGRLNGRQLREQGKPKPVEPKAAEPKAAEPTPSGAALPTPEPPPDASGSEPSRVPGDDDQPVADPSAAVEAVNIAWRSEEQDGPSAPAAAVSSTGLRREVFGFLPYWELSDSSTRIDYSKVSTIAYFGVGIAANGSLMKRNTDGTTTVGWSGWTSSRMTTLINTAHQNRTRVVLTVQSFAWTSGQLDRQKRFLGSSTARATLAKQVAAAVRDRGADGVNLDLEPLARGYEDEFTALVRRIRAELNNVRSGYQLTFDTTGHIGNYPIEAATAAGGADAIIVMGYDYRTAGSSPVGSIAPLSRTGYDIRDTIAAYRARVPASKLILGVPYYGRAWSTDSDDLHASNISGTKYGASTTVPYETAITYTAEHGRRYDATEGVAWTAYRRENCTGAYGCVTPWRQLISTTDRRSGPSMTSSTATTSAASASGRSAMTGRAPSCGRPSPTSSRRTRARPWSASETSGPASRIRRSPCPGPGPMRAASRATTSRSRSTGRPGSPGGMARRSRHGRTSAAKERATRSASARAT